jgi:large subunit ribosomal protein L9
VAVARAARAAAAAVPRAGASAPARAFAAAVGASSSSSLRSSSSSSSSAAAAAAPRRSAPPAARPLSRAPRVRVDRAVSIVLLTDVDTLGPSGHEVTVKPGYARNFLIPARLAVYATDMNRALYKREFTAEELRADEVHRKWRRAREAVQRFVLVASRPPPEGALEAPGADVDSMKVSPPLTAADVARVISRTPLRVLDIPEAHVRLPDGVAALDRYGEYTVSVLPTTGVPGLGRPGVDDWIPLSIRVLPM